MQQQQQQPNKKRLADFEILSILSQKAIISQCICRCDPFRCLFAPIAIAMFTICHAIPFKQHLLPFDATPFDTWTLYWSLESVASSTLILHTCKYWTETEIYIYILTLPSCALYPKWMLSAASFICCSRSQHHDITFRTKSEFKLILEWI